MLPLLSRSTRDGCKDRLNDGYTNDSLGGISRARCALLAKKGGMSEGRYYDHCVSILTHKYIICCSSQDSFMVMDTTEDVNSGWNCNSTQLPSYSSTLAIPFSLSSSCLNHACSMHSVHFLPYLNLERSTFVGLPPIVSMWSNGPLYRSSPMFQSQTLPPWPSVGATTTTVGLPPSGTTWRLRGGPSSNDAMCFNASVVSVKSPNVLASHSVNSCSFSGSLQCCFFEKQDSHAILAKLSIRVHEKKRETIPSWARYTFVVGTDAPLTSPAQGGRWEPLRGLFLLVTWFIAVHFDRPLTLPVFLTFSGGGDSTTLLFRFLDSLNLNVFFICTPLSFLAWRWASAAHSAATSLATLILSPFAPSSASRPPFARQTSFAWRPHTPFAPSPIWPKRFFSNPARWAEISFIFSYDWDSSAPLAFILLAFDRATCLRANTITWVIYTFFRSQSLQMSFGVSSRVILSTSTRLFTDIDPRQQRT